MAFALEELTALSLGRQFPSDVGDVHGTLEDLWAATEEFAAGWRTRAELEQHLHDWLVTNEGRALLEGQPIGRYLSFGHGGLVRRPTNGNWAGQGAPARRRGTTSPGGRASACESSTPPSTRSQWWAFPDPTGGRTSTYPTHQPRAT